MSRPGMRFGDPRHPLTANPHRNAPHVARKAGLAAKKVSPWGRTPACPTKRAAEIYHRNNHKRIGESK